MIRIMSYHMGSRAESAHPMPMGIRDSESHSAIVPSAAQTLRVMIRIFTVHILPIDDKAGPLHGLFAHNGNVLLLASSNKDGFFFENDCSRASRQMPWCAHGRTTSGLSRPHRPS